MKRRCYYGLLLLLFSGLSLNLSAQSGIASRPDSPEKTIAAKSRALSDSAQARLSTLQQVPGKYYDKITAKTRRFNRRITQRTDKALRRLQKQEEKINRKLAKVDSLASHNLLAKSIDSLSRLRALLKSKAAGITGKIPGKPYIPYLDTLKNALAFLDKYGDQLNGIKTAGQAWSGKLQNSLSGVKELEGRLDQLQNIRQYIAEQQQALKQSLSGYGDIFNRYLGKFGKEAYYYQAQIKNYKELWQHPDQVEAKALEMLNQVPAFGSFMKEHSMLAGLFRLPANYGSPQSLDGLQTRAMVEREIQEQLQAAGANGRQQIGNQMAMARQQLQQLKDKLTTGSTADMPDFKPKDLKSRTFLQRIELGANVGFSRADDYFPTTSDIAAQAAYKFSKNGSVGIGASFKLGWGSFGSAQEPPTNSVQEPPMNSVQEPANLARRPDNPGFPQGNMIKKIHFTAQGAGLRSFLDYKLKGSFYVNGGFEFSYNKTIPDIPALKNRNGWTKSALLGIEKKYKISDKVKGNMILLFDFLYRQHVPRTQPIVFRVGYNF